MTTTKHTAAQFERIYRRWVREFPHQCGCWASAAETERCVLDHGHAGEHMTRAQKQADDAKWQQNFLNNLEALEAWRQGK